MTPTQFQTLLRAVHDVGERMERVEARLAFEFPTTAEIREQLDAEVSSILAPGGSLRVFADD
jgi:hypothetical protein